MNSCEVGKSCFRNHRLPLLPLLTPEKNKTYTWCGIAHRSKESARGLRAPAVKMVVTPSSPSSRHGDEFNQLCSSHLLGLLHITDPNGP